MNLPSGKSHVAVCVSGHSQSASGGIQYLPPVEDTRHGQSAPRHQRATSTKCTALLPHSPVPQLRNQCQL